MNLAEKDSAGYDVVGSTKARDWTRMKLEENQQVLLKGYE